MLPTAYSFNHDGTCLYFAAVTVFLAQATDTALGWQQQLGLLLVLLLTSKGGAGVSGSAIAVLAMTLAATKTIPVGSIALVLGIHRMLSAASCSSTSSATAWPRWWWPWEKAVDTTMLDAELNAGAHSRSDSSRDDVAALAEPSPASARPAPDVVDESARGPR